MGWLPLRVCVQPQWVHSSCGTFKGIEAKYYDRRCLKINGYLILSQTWYLLGEKKIQAMPAKQNPGSENTHVLFMRERCPTPAQNYLNGQHCKICDVRRLKCIVIQKCGDNHSVTKLCCVNMIETYELYIERNRNNVMKL